MKLKFKSLQGSTFTVEADSSDTIANLKSKIESEHGHQAATQKIIYSGKILTDADTVQSCGVTEKDFLVLMVSKPKVVKASTSTATPAATTTTETPKEPSATSATPTTTSDATASSTATAPAAQPATAPEPSTTTPSAAATTPAPSDASSGPPGSSQFLTGSALEQAVNSMVEMGFEKSEVQKAMRASFNNPERAVEYLMTGIPEHLSQPQAAPAPASAPSAGQEGGQESTVPSATQPTASSNPRAGNLFEAAAAQAQGGGARAGAGTGGAGARGGAGGDSLAALRDLGEDDGSGNTALDLGNPAMLAQLRQLVQQNPAALTPLVQALAQSNPQLAHAMAEDPESVLNLLANNAAGGGEEGAGGEGIALPSMEDLNAEDRTAVETIIGMGIEETKAIEVYLMCGRNVEMAVQYYFDNPQDFED